MSDGPNPTGNPHPLCGGRNQPACPPQPADGIAYTADEVIALNAKAYAKGHLDALVTVVSISGSPQTDDL